MLLAELMMQQLSNIQQNNEVIYIDSFKNKEYILLLKKLQQNREWDITFDKAWQEKHIYFFMNMMS